MRYFPLAAATVVLIVISWAAANQLETSSGLVDSAAMVMSRSPKQRVELGLVRWGRDLDAAQRNSATSGKPILLLFQEVPG